MKNFDQANLTLSILRDQETNREPYYYLQVWEFGGDALNDL